MHVQVPNLERVRELVAAAEDARRPNSYVRAFEGWSGANALRGKILADYERDLSLLNGDAWCALKMSAAKRLIRNKKKDWEPLFDLLNEAKAHAYLAARGCANIQAIPPSYEYKTPDLKADLNGVLVLCEVKTLNMSDDERTVRAEDGSNRSSLSDEFLAGKLTWTLRAAKAQLDAFPLPARKIIYLVFNPDESLDDYADDYTQQLEVFLKAFPLGGIEVEVFQFLPLYGS